MAASVDEAAQYAAFVKDTMSQVHAGLELDHTDKKAKVATALKANVLDPDMRPAERVLLGRFALGADDSAYLQTGLATLWSTAPSSKDANGDDLALAPPGLYTPDAVDGIRAGLLRAMKSKNRLLERQSPAQLDALAPALRLLFSISTLRAAVAAKAKLSDADLTALLGLKWSERRAELEELLRKNDPNAAAKTTELADNLKKMRDVLAHLHDHLRDASGKGNGKTLTELILEAVQKQAKALEAAKARNLQLSKQLTATKMLLVREKQEHQKAKDKIVKLAVQKVDLKKQLDDCNNAKASLAQQLAAAQAELTEKANKITEVEGLLLALQQKHDQLERERERLEREGNELRSENTTLSNKNKDLEGQLQTRKQELELEKEKVEKQKEEAEKQKEEAERVQAEQRTEIRRQGEVIRTTGLKLVERNRERDDCRSQLKAKTTQMERTQTELAASKLAHEKCETQLKAANEKAAACEELRKECERLKATAAKESQAALATANQAAQTAEAELRAELEALKKQLTSNAVQRDKLYRELNTDAAEEAGLWRSVIKSHLDEDDPDEQQRADKARKLADGLSTFALKTMVDTAIGDYVIQSMLSAPAAVARDAAARTSVNPGGDNRAQLQADCASLKSTIRDSTAIGGQELQEIKTLLNDREGAAALEQLCLNLRLWKLYTPRTEEQSELLVLPIGVPEGDDGEGEVFCFVPLADDIGDALAASDDSVVRMGTLLSWLFNLPSTTDDGKVKTGWTLEAVDDDRGTQPQLRYLRFKLDGTALEMAARAQMGVVEKMFEFANQTGTVAANAMAAVGGAAKGVGSGVLGMGGAAAAAVGNATVATSSFAAAVANDVGQKARAWVGGWWRQPDEPPSAPPDPDDEEAEEVSSGGDGDEPLAAPGTDPELDARTPEQRLEDDLAKKKAEAKAAEDARKLANQTLDEEALLDSPPEGPAPSPPGAVVDQTSTGRWGKLVEAFSRHRHGTNALMQGFRLPNGKEGLMLAAVTSSMMGPDVVGGWTMEMSRLPGCSLHGLPLRTPDPSTMAMQVLDQARGMQLDPSDTLLVAHNKRLSESTPKFDRFLAVVPRSVASAFMTQMCLQASSTSPQGLLRLGHSERTSRALVAYSGIGSIEAFSASDAQNLFALSGAIDVSRQRALSRSTLLSTAMRRKRASDNATWTTAGIQSGGFHAYLHPNAPPPVSADETMALTIREDPSNATLDAMSTEHASLCQNLTEMVVELSGVPWLASAGPTREGVWEAGVNDEATFALTCPITSSWLGIDTLNTSNLEDNDRNERFVEVVVDQNGGIPAALENGRKALVEEISNPPPASTTVLTSQSELSEGQRNSIVSNTSMTLIENAYKRAADIGISVSIGPPRTPEEKGACDAAGHSKVYVNRTDEPVGEGATPLVADEAREQSRKDLDAAAKSAPQTWGEYFGSWGSAIKGALAAGAEEFEGEDDGPELTSMDDEGEVWKEDGPEQSFLASADGPAAALAHWVVARGLVGQRSPLDVAGSSSKATGADAMLPYELPSATELAAVLPHLKTLLDASDEPSEAQVQAVLAKRSPPATEPATSAEVLAAFEDDFAVIGTTPARAKDDRDGLEKPHEVRWMPKQNAHGRRAARVAALEHVAARCKQLADATTTADGDAKRPRLSATVRTALHDTAATLKLAQMRPLYALREAQAYDEPARTGCWAPHACADAPLVTRPCARIRGGLAFPTAAGVARVEGGGRRLSAETTLGDAAEAKAALGRRSLQTAQARNDARVQGRSPHVYVAPDPHELAFQAAPSASTGAAVSTSLFEDLDVSESLTPEDFTARSWMRIVRRALLATDAFAIPGDAAASAAGTVDRLLEAAADGGVEGIAVTPETRRDALWTEFRRHAGISQDRLWVFLRLLSGAVGGDVNEVITMADEATLRATKALQDQRVQIAKRVSDMQSKIVETVVGSMLRESKLAMDKNATGNRFVVVDTEARKQLRDLASGESGRPFFEANVAVRNLQNAAPQETTLNELLASLANVGGQLQRSLETTLTQPGAASASLTELSHPANCYFVSLKPDAVAAIRIAHERLNVELGMRGVPRRIHLWELVEGGSHMLSTRFAEFCGHALVQARSATGISAMYVSQQALMTNSIQARMALERLSHASAVYAHRVSVPRFALDDAGTTARDERKKTMSAGELIEDVDVGHAMRRALLPASGPAPALRAGPFANWNTIAGAGYAATR
jgi:hypothetical protein